MKNPIIFFAAILLWSSCGIKKNNAAGGETAEKFYKDLQTYQLDSAMSLISTERMSADALQEWKKTLNNNLSLFGDLVSWEKASGWNISTSTDNGTTMYIKYDTKYAHAHTSDSLTLHKDDDGMMRVIGFNWTILQADYIDNINKSEDLVEAYMYAIQSGNFDMAYDYVGYRGTETSKSEWLGMLRSTSAQTGKISEFQVLHESSTCNILGDEAEHPGNYYSVYVNSNCPSSTIRESILVYQPDYNAPLKVISHYRDQL
ncbi:MAG: hypothetical protein R2794_12080 [Chitinophagales bacterium]